MGCTRIAGSDYPMDTKFMTVSAPMKKIPVRNEPYRETFPAAEKYRPQVVSKGV